MLVPRLLVFVGPLGALIEFLQVYHLCRLGTDEGLTSLNRTQHDSSEEPDGDDSG